MFSYPQCFIHNSQQVKVPNLSSWQPNYRLNLLHRDSFFFFCKSQITNRRQIINVPRLFQSRRRNRKRKKFLENYPLFSRSKAHVEFESILIQQRGLERIAREREGAGVLRYRRRRECGGLRRGAAVSSN